MKVIPFSQNLIGKLIFFDKPFFKLSKILDKDSQFLEKLEEKTPLKFSSPLIEDPNPTRVLGKVQPTIKFNSVIFKKKAIKYLDYIIMGFGEHGYYYDLHLKITVDQELNSESIKPMLDEMEEISNIIESELGDFYFIKPSENRKQEISNFSMNLQFDKPVISILNSKITEQLDIIAKNSEEVIPGVENHVDFNFNLSIYPKAVEEGIMLNPKEIIVPRRVIRFKKDFTRPEQNNYSVNIRGLPALICIDFLEIVEKI